MDNIFVKNIFAAVFEKKVLDPLLAVLDPKEVKFWGTEGTVKYLKSKGYDAQSVVAGFDFDGRLKTIDKKVFAAILADKSKKRHVDELKNASLEIGTSGGLNPDVSNQNGDFTKPTATPITFANMTNSVFLDASDLTVVDLYKPDSGNFPESMDIGGQALIRAAVKNYKNVALAFDAESIKELIEELKSKRGETSLAFRKAQAQKAAKFIAERAKLEAELFS